MGSSSTLLNDFLSGTSVKVYQYLGSHITFEGVIFRVWAPHARSVSVVGDFNAWDQEANPMKKSMKRAFGKRLSYTQKSVIAINTALKRRGKIRC